MSVQASGGAALHTTVAGCGAAATQRDLTWPVRLWVQVRSVRSRNHPGERTALRKQPSEGQGWAERRHHRGT